MPRLTEILREPLTTARATTVSAATVMIDPAFSRPLLCFEIIGAAGESTGANATTAVMPSSNAATDSQALTAGSRATILWVVRPIVGKIIPVTIVHRTADLLCAPPAKNLIMATVPIENNVSHKAPAQKASERATPTLRRLRNKISIA
jgi:hypothetical protein